jgi:hypothetical protein
MYCRSHKLMQDNYWETNYSLTKANSSIHELCSHSAFLKSTSASCKGCFSLGRRHVKVLVNFLMELGAL